MPEDAYHDIGYLLVYHHFAYAALLVIVPVQCTDMAQVIATDVRILLIRLALHALPHAIGDGLSGKALIHTAEGLDGSIADNSASLPLFERLSVDCGCHGVTHIILQFQYSAYTLIDSLLTDYTSVHGLYYRIKGLGEVLRVKDDINAGLNSLYRSLLIAELLCYCSHLHRIGYDDVLVAQFSTQLVLQYYA